MKSTVHIELDKKETCARKENRQYLICTVTQRIH